MAPTKGRLGGPFWSRRSRSCGVFRLSRVATAAARLQCFPVPLAFILPALCWGRQLQASRGRARRLSEMGFDIKAALDGIVAFATQYYPFILAGFAILLLFGKSNPIR